MTPRGAGRRRQDSVWGTETQKKTMETVKHEWKWAKRKDEDKKSKKGIKKKRRARAKVRKTIDISELP